MHDIFLSHSHHDKEMAMKLKERLEELRFDVYADFDDPELQKQGNNLNHALVEKLKGKIRTCKVFLFVFSAESANSRWMPWELGLADGVVGNVLLWPLHPGAEQARETQEYLKLYNMLDSPSAAEREQKLRDLVATARSIAVQPAHEAMMRDLAGASIAERPRASEPGVAMEYAFFGPWRLYMAWMNALTGKR